MKSPEVTNQYSPVLIAERQEILAAIESECTAGIRPTVQGITYDRKGTFSCEQGTSYHHIDGVDIVGYHVVDATLIPEGGEFDHYGYRQQTDSSSGNGTQILDRLFGDCILYKHLNLGDPFDSQKPVPAISFYFARNEHQLNFAGIERSLFQNVGKLTQEGVAEGQTNEVAQQVVRVIGETTRNTVSSLTDAETILSDKAAESTAEQLATYGILLLADEKDRTAVHRPLRNWPDFKNLQMLGLVLDGRLPLYSDQQFRQMQERADGTSNRYERSDILPDVVAKNLLRIITAEDASKRELTAAGFAELVDHFDPDLVGEDPLLANIMLWALEKGLLKLDRHPLLNGSIRLGFHNLAAPLSLEVHAGESIQVSAYNGLITYLQAFPRAKRAEAKSRNLLQQLQVKAADEMSLGQDTHRLSQATSQVLINRFNKRAGIRVQSHRR